LVSQEELPEGKNNWRSYDEKLGAKGRRHVLGGQAGGRACSLRRNLEGEKDKRCSLRPRKINIDVKWGMVGYIGRNEFKNH